MNDIFSTPPDFTNEIGTRMWIDHATTQYAQIADIHGVRLDAMSFCTCDDSGRRNRILVNQDGTVIAEDRGLGSLAGQIDARKLDERNRLLAAKALSMMERGGK